MQSCIVNIKQDYNGYSKTLVFSQNKNYLINEIYTDLSATQDEVLNNKILEKFQKLSKGNATSITEAKTESLFPRNLSFAPDTEELKILAENSDFDFIVNVRTKKIRDQLGVVEIDKPFQFGKNSAFAILEVYDIKKSKKIYSQKTYSESSLEGSKDSYEIELDDSKRKDKDKGPYFNFSAESLSKKNLNKILNDIDKHAVK